ncbi:MAG: dihydroxyacetone kinase subunit L [Sphaerochaetaceae bacterium]|jgi:dihydroxyacetone kinase-like protein
MKIGMNEFQNMLASASSALNGKIDEFSRIDSLFGDGDHGVTMERISNEIRTVSKTPYDTVSQMLKDLGKRIMNVHGGSAGPLYGMVFDGFADGLMGVTEIGRDEIKAMFVGALENFSMVSNAKEGDKTMMDVLIAAHREAMQCKAELPQYMIKIGEAAQQGAERTKEYQAKFGRARFHKEATIGTMDAGACSLATLIQGMAEGLS